MSNIEQLSFLERDVPIKIPY